MMEPEALAKTMLAHLNHAADEALYRPHIDGDDLTETNIDGEINLIALAAFVLNQIAALHIVAD